MDRDQMPLFPSVMTDSQKFPSGTDGSYWEVMLDEMKPLGNTLSDGYFWAYSDGKSSEYRLLCYLIALHDYSPKSIPGTKLQYFSFFNTAEDAAGNRDERYRFNLGWNPTSHEVYLMPAGIEPVKLDEHITPKQMLKSLVDLYEVFLLSQGLLPN